MAASRVAVDEHHKVEAPGAEAGRGYAMQLACPRCRRVLEYAREAPSFCSYCGTALAPTRPELPAAQATTPPLGEPGAAGAGDVPERLGGYRLLRLLGAGGMGSVYEAEEATTGRRVALKLISPDFDASAAAVERFRQEGRLASSITHPRCVFVLAADEDAGRPYIVMELMPGETLEDLVEKHGPLPVEEAVARILDVIDGLREAHRLGVIHRDVKPSNCFVEADGRVKVGDFGLAKSLVQKGQLTHSGTFLGTLLYAAPEQIRGEAVGPQSDVYAVATTLYYLLAGQAPFQARDAAATLARIVADPVPPLRARRPDVPPGLEPVILRGLERDRARRWQKLDEFRAALLPFLPGRLSVGGVGLRFGAFMLDWLAVSLPPGLAQGALGLWMPSSGAGLFPLRAGVMALTPLAFFGYFTVLEGRWGCSLGKRLLRLRVWGARHSGPPGFGRALLRTAILFSLVFLPGDVISVWLQADAEAQKSALPAGLFYGLSAAGIALMLCTMRARNGYRCLHDLLSGTRVVQLPEPEEPYSLGGPSLEADLRPAAGVPDRLGAFTVRGVLRRDAETQVLLGEDPGLRRPVLLWLRPTDAPPLAEARRQLSRPARLRWLAGGRHGDFQWDAFLAPAGSPLAELASARGPLDWASARPLLEQLSDELAAAAEDGTLPETLTVGQVWVGANGQMLLLDTSLGGARGQAGEAAAGEDALALLGRAAVVLLEGKERAPGAPPGPVRAPLPPHAAALLFPLVGTGPGYKSARQFRVGFAAARNKPAAVKRPRRAASLLIQAALLAVGLFWMALAGMQPALVLTISDVLAEQNLEGARHDLRQGSYREFVARSAGPSPVGRLGALVQLDADLRADARLRARQQITATRHEARPGAVSPPMAYLLRSQEASLREQFRQARASMPALPFRWQAAYLAQDDRSLEGVLLLFLMASLAFWPAVWVAWAFVMRGGLSLRLAGLALVRGDGRRAPRWQCAWRALLVWGPVTALLLGSLALGAWYWKTWDVTNPHRWAVWLSIAAWWGGWALLLAYVVVALRNPVRGPHDRLAGTYLVPR